MSNGKSAINPWFIAVTVTLATFMELLDTSIANVALPYIGGGLGRSYDEVTWILTTYLVAIAVILPMSAWLSRVFGREKYYLGCVALFTLTSLFCGTGTLPRDHAFQPCTAGSCRRRIGSGITSDSGGHIPCGQTCVGVRSVHDRNRDSPGDRACPGRLDHRQLQLALDILHQHSDRLLVFLPERRARTRSPGV